VKIHKRHGGIRYDNDLLHRSNPSGVDVMRELKPYRTMHGLRTAIDNGGRFYNLFTRADDHVVTRGELAKAAGVFTAGVNAFLFLEMAQQDLQSGDRQAILTRL
jgi:hypothetical protein